MKIIPAIALVLLLALTPIAANVAEDPATPDNMTNILPDSDGPPAAPNDRSAPAPSALDLSLLGIISLGVLGLFWIRRHTSEL